MSGSGYNSSSSGSGGSGGMNGVGANGVGAGSGGGAGVGAGAGPKKLVIKPFKAQPRLPDNYEEITWQRLRAAVDAVFYKTSVAISKEELYQVSAGHSESYFL
jgi:uncharacterized spore protein YtfJ